MASKHEELRCKITNAIVEVCRTEAFYFKELRVEGTVCLVSDGQSVLITQLTEQIGEDPASLMDDDTQLPVLDKSHTEKRHQCPQCDKSYSLKQNLRDHMNTHSGARPHVCKQCGSSFTHLSNLCAHVRRKHENQQSSSNTPSTSSSPVNAGVFPNHEESDEDYEPPSKLKIIQPPSNPYTDIIKMQEGKSIQAPQNPYTDIVKTPEGKFQCPFCEKNYSFKHTLKDHLNKHTGLRPHVCKHCGDSFTHLASLCNHIKRRHEDMMPAEFQCEICQERFMNYQSVKQHYTWRHKDIPFPKHFTHSTAPKPAPVPPTITSPSTQDEQKLKLITDYFEQVNDRLRCKICAELLCNSDDLFVHIGKHLGEGFCEMLPNNGS